MSKNGPQPLQGVVCLVFYEDGKLLLEQRLDDDKFYGRWTFTGGKVERGETIESASIREAEEETGLLPKELTRFTSFEGISRKGGSYLFYGVFVHTWKGELQNREPRRRGLRWVPLSRAAFYIGDTEVDRRVLEAFLKFYKS